MEPIILYFIKSGALIVLFLSAYYFFLRKETFFKSNRWFLLFGLVISVLLPVVTFKKTIWVEPTPIAEYTPAYASGTVPAYAYEASDSPAEAIAIVVPEKTFEIDWFWVGLAVYALGILALLVKFALDYYALKKVLKGKAVYQQEDYKFVNVEDNIAPFSYFNYIVYNPQLYSATEMENILEHEKVHCSQNHTLDVLIARLFCIVFWWNPFVWFYKKAIVQNLEFIADSDASKNISDKKAYQFTLLKITTHESCVAISNHFFQSLIKKRIVMLNKNQSKRWNSWKYAIIVPLLAVFMWQFQVKVVAQEKPSEEVIVTPYTVEREITATTSDEKLKEIAASFKDEFGASLEFSRVKRNNKGEIISLKATLKGKNTTSKSKSVYEVSGNNPIKAFKVYADVDSSGKEGFGFGEITTYNGSVAAATAVAVGEEEEMEDVAVATYYTDNEDIVPPTPPAPPTPPTVPSYPTPPTPPNFPTPPTPPTVANTGSNKKAWAKFEEAMKKFEAKMNSAEMKQWEKDIEEYSKKMDAMNPDTAAFDKEMQAFDKEMQAFDKEMKVFEKEMQEFTRQIQEEVRIDVTKEREEMQKYREEARKEREKARAEAQKLREKTKKERDAAIKNKK